MESFSPHDSNLVAQEEQHGGGPHSGAGGGRAERLAEELDDMERRVEQVIVEHRYLKPLGRLWWVSAA